MPILIEKPQSFEIEKFLLAATSSWRPQLSLINPYTGKEIFHQLVNIPKIGLTFQPTPNNGRSIGFLGTTPRLVEDKIDNGPEFEQEAILLLDVDPRDLPVGVEEAWVIQVKNQKSESAYIPVAEILSTRFDNITVIITSEYQDNTNPETDDGIPLNPDYPDANKHCPVVIRKTEIIEIIK